MSAGRAKFIENPLSSILGGVVVLLLGFLLTVPNSRIDETNARIDETNARITSLETKMDRKIDDLEVKVDDINLKLTALIAALNKTSGSMPISPVTSPLRTPEQAARNFCPRA